MTDTITPQYDVKVENAFKRYGNNNVINGLNMCVTPGSIYGLLGPSGCGKTTLLQCILGTMTLDYGSIDLNVKCLNDVGYMPQDTSLENTLTCKEMIKFYGTLYNMSNKEVKNRIFDLNKFLKLPDLNRFISELSGGQSRRLSLAISILHSPKFIILDEPTVGIDPVIRQIIWDEFIKMAKEQTNTIIITTHYIEEAKLADTIGLMRNGILVEEGSPRQILSKYNTDSMEECFLRACCHQETNSIVHNKTTPIQVNAQLNKLNTFRNDLSFHRIKALLMKHYYVSVRDYILLFTMIILPLFQAINFCYGVGTNINDMLISVKNDEISVFDCQYANVNGCIFDSNSTQTMSCVVLNYLQSSNYKLVEVKDREDGELSMKNPTYMAFLYFPKNFTEELITYFDDREYYEQLIYASITKDNFVYRNQIRKDVWRSVKYLTNKSLNDCSYNPKATSMPLSFNIVYGQEVLSLGNGIVTFFLAMMIFHISSTFSLSIMMAEKMDGTLNRSMISGVKVLELIISMFVLDTLIIVVQMLILCFIAFVCFMNPIQITNGLFLYIFLTIFIGWIGFLSGLIAAVITPTKVGGIFMIIGFTMSQFLLSGAVWPMDGQPELLRRGAELLPIRLIGNTMNNIALKGWTLSHPSILIGTTVTFVGTILIIIFIILLGKLKKDLWVIQK